MKRTNISGLTYALIFAVSFLLDRVTKLFALYYAQTSWEITGFFSCVLEFNRGISWGLFDSTDQRLFLMVSGIIGLIILAVAFYTFICWMNHERIIGHVLILSGALSNMVDRWIHHGVVDFMLVSCKGWSFPLFNVADVFIVLGVLLMLYEGAE